jgi:hypothetical protein
MAKEGKIKTAVFVLTALTVAATVIAIAIAIRSGASVPVPFLVVIWLPLVLLWSALKKIKL